MKLISERYVGEIATLEARLIEFYNTFAAYPAFSQPSEYPALWEAVIKHAKQVNRDTGSCRILEIGAGRSGFGPFLRRDHDGGKIHLTSQDITAANVNYLRSTSDSVVTENIDRLEGTWDIIFHSYVYEHLCRPRAFNEMLWSHLAVGGYLLIQSPCYDTPWYFPPCFDHLRKAEKLWDALRLWGSDFVSLFDKQPRFTIFSDPAIFHLPFESDRDAVHRVRKSDIRSLFATRAKCTNFHLPSGSRKDWIVKEFLTLRMILQKVS